ncbi:complement C3-like isoform X2 [Amphiprion ocellaris]|uniref:complement C3-like isoform X2 n=1 Tax=Amphiprion ocellaris TaxID=80972 RepID=UPI0024113955|nr:complement C3-like isoform X2 [Amphiprion ocellaris]
MDGWMDGWMGSMDIWMEGWRDGQTHGWTDGRTDGWMEGGTDGRTGYENQLAYRRSGGSCVSVRRIRGTGASTWLPQCQDHSVRGEGVADDGRFAIIGINEQQVCDPLLYLVKNKFRHREKIYVEDNPVYSTTMTGGLCGDDPETTLTAFVHIGPTFVHNALKQAGIHCSSPGVNVEEAIRSTSAYLKRALTKPVGRGDHTRWPSPLMPWLWTACPPLFMNFYSEVQLQVSATGLTGKTTCSCWRRPAMPCWLWSSGDEWRKLLHPSNG